MLQAIPREVAKKPDGIQFACGYEANALTMLNRKHPQSPVFREKGQINALFEPNNIS